MAGKVDLGACIVARAFQRLHRTFAKLGMEHFLFNLEAVCRLLFARNFSAKLACRPRITCVSSY